MSVEYQYVFVCGGGVCQEGLIFDKVDICILCGKVIGIMGFFGCGKIILLWLIVVELCFFVGDVCIGGVSLLKLLCDELFVRKV